MLNTITVKYIEYLEFRGIRSDHWYFSELILKDAELCGRITCFRDEFDGPIVEFISHKTNRTFKLVKGFPGHYWVSYGTCPWTKKDIYKTSLYWNKLWIRIEKNLALQCGGLFTNT